MSEPNMSESDFVQSFDHLPEELSTDEEIAESPPKSSNSRDKHRLATRRRVEEILEAKRLHKELNDFQENNEDLMRFYEDPYDYFEESAETEPRQH